MRNRVRSSLTADAAVAARAYGAMETDPKLRGPDDLAIRFVSTFFRVALLPGVRSRFVAELERRAAGAFFLHQARTRHIDAVLATELAYGRVEQFVLLGAGFDSRAYRFASKLGGVQVFEVDHPATSAVKQKRVRRAFGSLPSHVIYVAVDFSKEEVEHRLAATGYDGSRRTFFLWEGVTYYLEASAVEATLAIVGHAAKGSSIVFDYHHPAALDKADAAMARHIATAEMLGEPYQSGIDPTELPLLLARHNLVLEENLGAEELGARYLVRTDGSRWGRINPFTYLAHARHA